MKLNDTEGQILVRLVRGVLGSTQEDLAGAAGVDPSTIHRYETGQQSTSPEALERICVAAGISSSFLRGRLAPFVVAVKAEINTGGAGSKGGIEELADEIGRKVGASAREQALDFLAGLKPLE